MNDLEKILSPHQLTTGEYREKATAIEEFLLTLPQIEFEVKQLFIPGAYMRELTIPKDMVLTGAVHKEECITIISKGSILISAEDGGKHLVAGDSFVTPAGVKRIGIGLEDTLCVTVHKYDGEHLDEDEMKQIIGCDTYALYDEFLAQRSLLCQQE